MAERGTPNAKRLHFTMFKRNFASLKGYTRAYLGLVKFKMRLVK